MDINNMVQTIPVVIDSVKNIEEINLTRVTYFSVECASPNEFHLSLSGLELDILLLDLSGVITKPMNGNSFFKESEDFENIFNFIESKDNFFIDVNDLWIPNRIFGNVDFLHREQIYRINIELFNFCYWNKEEYKNDNDFINLITDLNLPLEIQYSELETQALKYWNEQQIGEIQKSYHNNPDNNLEKKGDYQEPLPPLTQ